MKKETPKSQPVKEKHTHTHTHTHTKFSKLVNKNELKLNGKNF